MNIGQNYWMVGPIQNKSQVLISVTHNGYLYFLTQNGNNLVFDCRSPLLLGSSTPILAVANTNGSSVSFNVVNSNNIVLDQSNHPMISTNSPAKMQTVAIDLNVGNQIVAGGFYHFNFNNQLVKFFAYTPVPAVNDQKDNPFATDILLDDKGAAVLTEITEGIRLVPILWYLSTSCSTIPQNTNQTITNEANWVVSQTDPSVIFERGFVLQSDCNNGIFYDYCFLPASCGQANNCFGACPNGGTCKLNTSNSTFQCNGSSSTSNWWWWVIIGIIILIVIILIVLAIWYAFRPTYVVTDVTTTNVPRQVQFGGVEYYSPEASMQGFEGETLLV